MRGELARSPELAQAQVPAPGDSLREELSRLAEVAPEAAVIAAYHRIEDRLAGMLEGDSPAGTRPYSALDGRALARLARERGLISDETLAALEGLSVLRDLTAYTGDIGADRARDYLSLADAVLYALRSKRSG